MEERRGLWEDICNHQDLHMFRNKQWIIVGDFNKVLEGSEHFGYDNDPSIPSGMREFQRVASHCCLPDISSQGPLFTWSNKRKESLVCKKLDRVLVNNVWLHKCTQSYVVFGSGGCSDHLRSRTQITIEDVKKRSLFRFTKQLERCWSSFD